MVPAHIIGDCLGRIFCIVGIELFTSLHRLGIYVPRICGNRYEQFLRKNWRHRYSGDHHSFTSHWETYGGNLGSSSCWRISRLAHISHWLCLVGNSIPFLPGYVEHMDVRLR